MKKIILVMGIMLCLTGCQRNMNEMIENDSSVTGVVEEVHEKYIIMTSEKTAGYTDIAIGDEIVVFYDKVTAETDPLQLSVVYAITLKTPPAEPRTVNLD